MQATATTWWGNLSIVLGSFAAMTTALATVTPPGKWQQGLLTASGILGGIVGITNGNGNRQSKTGDPSS